jgi:predicted dehydrogenase
VHLLDLCRWFTGDEFTRVQAVVATEFWPMPVEDTAFCLLRTAGGVTCSVLVSLVEWKNKFHFEAVGEKGSLMVEGLGGSYGPERLTVIRRPPEFGVPQVATQEFEHPESCWAEEWAEFTAAVREGRRPPGDISDSLAVLRLAEACYRAC